MSIEARQPNHTIFFRIVCSRWCSCSLLRNNCRVVLIQRHFHGLQMARIQLMRCPAISFNDLICVHSILLRAVDVFLLRAVDVSFFSIERFVDRRILSFFALKSGLSVESSCRRVSTVYMSLSNLSASGHFVVGNWGRKWDMEVVDARVKRIWCRYNVSWLMHQKQGTVHCDASSSESHWFFSIQSWVTKSYAWKHDLCPFGLQWRLHFTILLAGGNSIMTCSFHNER